MSELYGLQLPRTEYEQHHELPRDLLGPLERSASGNVILRVGREHAARESWEQIAHVVLTPSEARALALELLESIDD